MLLLYMAAAVVVSALVIARTDRSLQRLLVLLFPSHTVVYATLFEDGSLVTTMIAGLQLICSA